MKFTTLSSWALMVANTVSESGVDSDELFREAGLATEKLGMPNARYPVDRLQQLWKLARDATANPNLGLDVVRHWHPTTMHALGYAWLASDSLSAAMDRTVRYGRIVSTDLHFDVNTTSNQVEFSFYYDNRRPDPIDEEVDAVVVALLHMCRATFGGPFQPTRVHMTRASPRDQTPYRQALGEAVQYSATRNAIVVPKSDAARRLATANVDLARASDNIALKHLARIESGQLSLRVREVIAEYLHSGNVSQRSIAKNLGISSRGLQRRLSREGTSYQKVLDETRSDLALDYLTLGHSHQEIAFKLGFSDSSAFAKAFRRWFGIAPTDYQRDNRQQDYTLTFQGVDES